jgi:hypothetical protein
MYERGFNNLHDVIIEEAPANTYSFIFRGISQILDHIFVDEVTLDELVIARYIHVNVDYPAETRVRARPRRLRPRPAVRPLRLRHRGGAAVRSDREGSVHGRWLEDLHRPELPQPGPVRRLRLGQGCPRAGMRFR